MKLEPRYLDVDGNSVVMLLVKDYERLAIMADVWEPALPKPNAEGNYPAEAIAIVMAQGILRDRRKLGLTQAELARLAGIRVATLNRIEHGQIPKTGKTIDKIDRALKKAHAVKNGRTKSK